MHGHHHSGGCIEYSMELATRFDGAFSASRRRAELVLPVDPRPLLDRVVQRLAAAAKQNGATVKNVAKPRPYSFGDAYRRAQWFDHVRYFCGAPSEEA